MNIHAIARVCHVAQHALAHQLDNDGLQPVTELTEEERAMCVSDVAALLAEDMKPAVFYNRERGDGPKFRNLPLEEQAAIRLFVSTVRALAPLLTDEAEPPLSEPDGERPSSQGEPETTFDLAESLEAKSAAAPESELETIRRDFP